MHAQLSLKLYPWEAKHFCSQLLQCSEKSRGKLDYAAKKLKKKLADKDDIIKEIRYYVKLPSTESHEFHDLDEVFIYCALF